MGTFQYMGGGNSEAQDRLATSFLLAQTSPGLATTGVLSGLAVTQTPTASGAVLVAAGAAPVQASVGTGVALLVNDTQATLDVLTAHPMGGLPRNDIVAFASVTKTLIAIKGEPNATPDDPTVPDTACALARLRHAASATTIPTAKIDSLIARTFLNGGMRRLVAPAVVSANQGPISTTDSQVLTSGSTQVCSPGGQVRLTLSMLASGTVQDDVFIFRVRDGSPTGTELTGARVYMTITNTTHTSALLVASVAVSAGVARTLYVTVTRSSGTGTITVLPGTTLIVDEDPS